MSDVEGDLLTTMMDAARCFRKLCGGTPDHASLPTINQFVPDISPRNEVRFNVSG